MTLSQIIKLRTNNGRDVIDFLVDVMHDRYDDFQMTHRLQAARLLTTYGNEDAPNFIDDNTTDSSSNTGPRKPRRPTRFDTELARVIRDDTGDGRSIARFLTNVMDGELKSFRPHHRISAARELLDRGFGKSAREEKIVRPEPVEGPKPTEGSLSKDTVNGPSPSGRGVGVRVKRSFRPVQNPLRQEPVEGPKPPRNKLSLLTPLNSLLKKPPTSSTPSSTSNPSALSKPSSISLRASAMTRPPSRPHWRRRHRRHHQPGPPWP